jgi:hypothetical protein
MQVIVWMTCHSHGTRLGWVPELAMTSPVLDECFNPTNCLSTGAIG